MKRLLGLVVLFVVLSACVPTYGFFLVYKVSGSAKGVNNSTPATIPWKAYLVMKIDPSSYTLVDANLIMYGKDSRKAKVYVEHNKSNSNHSLNANFRQQGSFFILEPWATTPPFDFSCYTLGKMSLKDIGAESTKWVAGSYKGSFMVWHNMLLDAEDDIAGVGTVSASLWTTFTKTVNKNGWSQEEVFQYLKYNILEDSGYVEATLP